MGIIETFELAIKNLLASKVRALLTMLGIIIGVAAVIVIIAMGNGMENYMEDSFESMGTNLLTVNVMGRGTSRSISVEDMYEFVDENTDYFAAMSPTVSVSATIKVDTDELSSTTITGIAEDYNEMQSLELSSGRFIQYVDIMAYKKVCVIGSYIAQDFFGGNAIGREIKINGTKYQIIGVLEETAESTEGDGDDVIYLPYTVAMKASGTGTVSSYALEIASEDTVSESKDAVETFLYEEFDDENAYRVNSMAEMLETMTSMINILVTVLAAIAAISLVVGGIGIMNIMLVSVSERTREIGIRKSLGAKQKHIMRQFVIEAATTSAIGGLMGIAVGYLLSSIGTSIVTVMLEAEMSLTPTMGSVLLAFGVSVSIGILFGYLPAKKAAKLNPIDALRYD